MQLDVASLAQRPDLAPLLDEFVSGWPEFMNWDPIAPLYYAIAHREFPEFVLAAIDPAEPGRVVAQAYSVPLAWGDEPLPPGGWDRVIQRATLNKLLGTPTNLVSALEISVRPDQRGRGLSGRMLAAMRDNVRSLGYDTLVAPVRPNGKHTRPDESMADYLNRVRPDGLPEDPWLRTHVRAGGKIEAVAPRSMTVPGTLEEWRRWTGLPFDRTGPVHVPGALAPVHCDAEQGHAVYVEPNVWVRHEL